MIRIIKFIVFSSSWFFMFKSLNKSNYRSFLDSFSTHLRSLNIWNLFEVLKNLLTDSMPENLLLRGISIPLGVDWKVLNDTKTKKFFLVGFVFTIIVNRWLHFFKRVFLWPFKLGIFSFVYSVLGIDVTWFLKFWDFFSINIPHWVYVQYLTLYNNWLNWWYNTVKIKSLTSVPLIEAKKKLSENKPKIIPEIQPENNNSKVWYVVGFITLVAGLGLTLWYFGVFNSSNPGPSAGSNSSSGFPVSHVTESSFNNNYYSSPENTRELITITNNKTRPNIYDPIEEINNAWNQRSLGSSNSNLDASSSSATSNPWGSEGAPSPTNSNDSTETITNLKFKRGFLKRKSND